MSEQKAPLEEVSQLVEEHGDVLYRYARWRVNSHEVAEDLVQSTFTSVLKDWQSFRRESSVKTWLISILRHKLIDYYRKKKPESIEDIPEDITMAAKAAEESSEMVQDAESIRLNPEEILENKELRITLRECLDNLQERFRQVFVIRDLENKSTEFICENLNINPTNFSVIMYRVRMQLRDCFIKHGFPYSFQR